MKLNEGRNGPADLRVFANSDYVGWIQKQNRKIRAIEMESYGFLHAISEANEPQADSDRGKERLRFRRQPER